MSLPFPVVGSITDTFASTCKLQASGVLIYRYHGYCDRNVNMSPKKRRENPPFLFPKLIAKSLFGPSGSSIRPARIFRCLKDNLAHSSSRRFYLYRDTDLGYCDHQRPPYTRHRHSLLPCRTSSVSQTPECCRFDS